METGRGKRGRLWKLKLMFLGAGLVYAGSLLTVQASEWIVRHRAERLLQDFRTLRAGKSTFAEVQSVRSRWPSETYDGPCNATHCDLVVEFHDWTSGLLLKISYFGETTQYLSRTAAILFRDHQPLVTWDASVRNGLLERSLFRIETKVPKGYGPGWEGAGPEPQGYVEYRTGDYAVVAHTSSVIGPLTFPVDSTQASHPAYIMSPPGGCEGCMGFLTEFTLNASEPDVNWLTAFDLSCMTRWSTCAEAGELLPQAWARYKVERIPWPPPVTP
jgi:hypothetical protein